MQHAPAPTVRPAPTDPPARPPPRGWQPHPVPPPRVDPELPDLSAPCRAAETLRFWLFKLEHFVSPGGALRELVRLTLFVSLALLAPCLLVLPLLEAGSASAARCAADLHAAARHLSMAALFALALLALLRLLGRALALMLRRRGGR